MVATVPCLVDQTDSPSLTWQHAVHHAVVPSNDVERTPGEWGSHDLLDGPLVARVERHDQKHAQDRVKNHVDVSFAVEFNDSQCTIRLLPGIDEVIGTIYTWRCFDVVRILGIHETDITNSLSIYLAKASITVRELSSTASGARLLRELWAAGYLLGWDAARLGAKPTVDPPGLAMRANAVASWIGSGIGERTLPNPSPAQTQALLEAGLAAVASGVQGTERVRARRTPDSYGLTPALRAALTDMARRDAWALSSPPKIATMEDDAGLTSLDLVVLPCPWCGLGSDSVYELPRTLPLGRVTIIGAYNVGKSGSPSLALLACERPSGRSLIAIAKAVEGDPTGSWQFQTRAAAYVRAGLSLAPTRDELGEWFDALGVLETQPESELFVTMPCASDTVGERHLPWNQDADIFDFYYDARAVELFQLTTDRARQAGRNARGWDSNRSIQIHGPVGAEPLETERQGDDVFRSRVIDLQDAHRSKGSFDGAVHIADRVNI